MPNLIKIQAYESLIKIIKDQIKELLIRDIDRYTFSSTERIINNKDTDILISNADEVIARLEILKKFDEEYQELIKQDWEESLKDFKVIEPSKMNPEVALGIPNPDKIDDCEYRKEFPYIPECKPEPTDIEFEQRIAKATGLQIGKDYGLICGTPSPYLASQGMVLSSHINGFEVWRKKGTFTRRKRMNSEGAEQNLNNIIEFLLEPFINE